MVRGKIGHRVRARVWGLDNVLHQLLVAGGARVGEVPGKGVGVRGQGGVDAGAVSSSGCARTGASTRKALLTMARTA